MIGRLIDDKDDDRDNSKVVFIGEESGLITFVEIFLAVDKDLCARELMRI